MLRRPPRSTLFPYTTLFRSVGAGGVEAQQRNPLPRFLEEDAMGRIAHGNGDVTPEDRLVVRHRSEEHTSELQSLRHLVCRLLLEKKKKEQTPLPPIAIQIR